MEHTDSLTRILDTGATSGVIIVNCNRMCFIQIMKYNELRNLPPPWIISPKGSLINMSTEEEVRAMERSESVAYEILGAETGELQASEQISYNEYIQQMRIRGIASRFANIALENLGYRPGPDAVLIAR